MKHFVNHDLEIVSEIVLTDVLHDSGLERTMVDRETLVFFGYTTAWEPITVMEFYFLACEYLFAHCRTFISSNNAEIGEVAFQPRPVV